MLKLAEAANLYKEMESLEALARTYDNLADIRRDNSWSAVAPAQQLIVRYQQAIDSYSLEAELYRLKLKTSPAARP